MYVMLMIATIPKQTAAIMENSLELDGPTGPPAVFGMFALSFSNDFNVLLLLSFIVLFPILLSVI